MVVRVHPDATVVGQIGEDEQRIVEATAADLHHQLTPPASH